jgi:hypothetical protein
MADDKITNYQTPLPTSAEEPKYKWTLRARILYPFAVLAVIVPPVFIAYVIFSAVFLSGDPLTPEEIRYHKTAVEVAELSKGDPDKFDDIMDVIYGRGLYADPAGTPTKELAEH